MSQSHHECGRCGSQAVTYSESALGEPYRHAACADCGSRYDVKELAGEAMSEVRDSLLT